MDALGITPVGRIQGATDEGAWLRAARQMPVQEVKCAAPFAPDALVLSHG
jgi:hypothetical protein